MRTAVAGDVSLLWKQEWSSLTRDSVKRCMQWALKVCHTSWPFIWHFTPTLQMEQNFPKLVYGRIRLHDIFVFHDGRSGNHRAIISCRALVVGLALLQVWPQPEIVHHGYGRNVNKHAIQYTLDLLRGVPNTTSQFFDNVTLQDLLIIPIVHIWAQCWKFCSMMMQCHTNWGTAH